MTSSNILTYPPAAQGRHGALVVGVADLAVSVAGHLATPALGSTLAVCIWDPQSRIGGLLHLLLPEASLNRERANARPATFADSGIPLLLQMASARGFQREACKVCLVGGADVPGLSGDSALGIGLCNLLTARQTLQGLGIAIDSERTGGHMPRSIAFSVDDGTIEVTSGRTHVERL